MNKAPSKEPARHVANAFAAASPDSRTTAQSQPEPFHATTPTAQKISCAYCGCYISDFLVTKLHMGFACPTCTTNVVVKATKRVQKRMIDRGGAFASTEQGKGHARIRQDWRFAKISLTNRVAKWEDLMCDACMPPEDKTNIKNALAIWENNIMGLSDIPGLRYSEEVERDEPTAEEHEAARLMMELIKLIIEKELAKEERVPQQNSGKRKRVDAPWDKQSVSSSPRKKHGVRHDVPGERAAVASSHSEAHLSPSTPKSILKRKACTPSPETPRQKRIRIADTVTISPPRLNISNPSPFIELSDTVATRTHSIYSSAEHQRHRHTFKRSAPHYAPGVWASGPLHEKARTSNCKSNWDRTEKNVMNEVMEAEVEQKVFKRIKAVSGAWMGVWWVSKVTRHLDLKQLKEKIEMG